MMAMVVGERVEERVEVVRRRRRKKKKKMKKMMRWKKLEEIVLFCFR